MARVLAEQLGFNVAGSATVNVVANVVKGKDTYNITVDSGTNVGMVPCDASGRILTFGSIDSALKFVGRACENVSITVNLPITESVKLWRKPVYPTLAAAQAAEKLALQKRVSFISAIRTKLAALQLDYESLGYNTSVIPAVKAKYDNLVLDIATIDAGLTDINARIAALP